MQDRWPLDLEVILSRFSVKRAFCLGKVKKVCFKRVFAVQLAALFMTLNFLVQALMPEISHC